MTTETTDFNTPLKSIALKLYGALGGMVLVTLAVLAACILAPHFGYDTWLILTIILLTGLCTLCWLGYYCKQLTALYASCTKQLFETKLALHRESTRRSGAI